MEIDIFKEIGICSCGNPNEVINFIIQMLEIFAEREVLVKQKASNDVFHENFSKVEKLLGYDINVGNYYFILYWLNNKKYIEHSSTIESSKITEKGKNTLEECKRYLGKNFGVNLT